MKALSVSTYVALRNKIRETLLLGQQRIEEAKVRTYWETGSFINQHVQANGGRAEYGQKVVLRLAEDINLHPSVLQRCSQFAETFPDFKIVATWRQLAWAHFRILITIPTRKVREEFARRANRENWNVPKLQQMVLFKVRNLLGDERGGTSGGKASWLLSVPTLGPFYTYKIIAPETIHSRAAEPLLDVGFSGTKKLMQFTSAKFPSARAVKSSADGTWDMSHKYKPGTIVTSIKDSKGRYSLEKTRSSDLSRPGLGRGDDLLYNYQAYVTRIVDGDTLKLEIDTGFDDQKHETIRLRGIDCPELDTPEGQAAKRFVERELAHCEFITVKSTQTRKEKWGRYLGDIFYTNKAGQQVYLNNLLLEKGHAVRVRD